MTVDVKLALEHAVMPFAGLGLAVNAAVRPLRDLVEIEIQVQGLSVACERLPADLSDAEMVGRFLTRWGPLLRVLYQVQGGPLRTPDLTESLPTFAPSDHDHRQAT